MKYMKNMHTDKSRYLARHMQHAWNLGLEAGFRGDAFVTQSQCLREMVLVPIGHESECFAAYKEAYNFYRGEHPEKFYAANAPAPTAHKVR